MITPFRTQWWKKRDSRKTPHPSRLDLVRSTTTLTMPSIWGNHLFRLKYYIVKYSMIFYTQIFFWSEYQSHPAYWTTTGSDRRRIGLQMARTTACPIAALEFWDLSLCPNQESVLWVSWEHLLPHEQMPKAIHLGCFKRRGWRIWQFWVLFC